MSFVYAIKVPDLLKIYISYGKWDCDQAAKLKSTKRRVKTSRHRSRELNWDALLNGCSVEVLEAGVPYCNIHKARQQFMDWYRSLGWEMYNTREAARNLAITPRLVNPKRLKLTEYLEAQPDGCRFPCGPCVWHMHDCGATTNNGYVGKTSRPNFREPKDYLSLLLGGQHRNSYLQKWFDEARERDRRSIVVDVLAELGNPIERSQAERKYIKEKKTMIHKGCNQVMPSGKAAW